jgi:uncharacterized protein involved in cysteine biosynthesis
MGGLFRGFFSYGRSLSWLKAHPQSFLLLLIPVVLGFASFAFIGVGILQYSDHIIDYVVFSKPENYFYLVAYYIVIGLLYLAIFSLAVLISFLVSVVLSSPIYEIVSLRVEKSITGRDVEEFSIFDFKAQFTIIKAELYKWLFIISVSLVILLIPVLNAISVFVTAFLLGWDYYDLSLARKGLTFSKRLSFVTRHALEVFGLGLILLIPFAQFVLGPVAVVSGTILSVEQYEKKRGSLIK